MAGKVTWQIKGTSSDGTEVIIDVTATLNDDGSITVDYALADGSADADIIGVYFDFFNDGGDVDKIGGGNNMKGYGDGFDVGFEEGTAGLKDGANIDGSMTFTAEQLKAFGFVDDEGNALEGAALMEAFAETEIGIRATSTGDDGEGSLKIGDVGKYHPEDDDKDEFFPVIDQGISYVMLVFDKPFGKDEYYTVKIDSWPGGDDELFDLNDHIEDIIAWLIECDPNIDADTPLLGAKIKSGANVETLFYAYGEFDENGPEPDDFPEKWGVTPGANPNAAWGGDVDATFNFADVYNEDCDCIC